MVEAQFVITIVFTVFLSVTAADTKWKTINNTKSEILVANETLNFIQAEANCIKLKGHLATAPNSSYQQAIYDLAKSNGDGLYWIGLTDYYKDMSFQWTSGYQPVLVSSFWGNKGVAKKNQMVDCIAINTSAAVDKSWFNLECSTKLASVCLKGGLQPHAKPMPLVKKAGSCPEGFFRISNRCLKIVTKTRSSWTDARKACQKFGTKGDLASIVNDQEQNILTAMMINQPVGFWIGLYRPKSNPNTHQWVRNQTVSYTNWKEGEPNGFISESCVMIYRRNKNPGEWNDQGCNSKLGYICESNLLDAKEHKAANDPLFIRGPKCKDNEYYYDDFCYWQVNKSISFEKAEEKCQSEGKGHLVSPHNLYESGYLRAFMDKFKIPSTFLGYRFNNLEVTSSDSITAGIDLFLKGFDYSKLKLKVSCLSVSLRPEFQVNAVPCTVEEKDSFTPICRYAVPGSGRHPDSYNYTCDKGWEKLSNKKCGKLFSDPKTFIDADKDCQQRDGNLTSISTAHEQGKVSDMASKATGSTDVWIGLYVWKETSSHRINMKWIDGTDVTYTHWRTSEPSIFSRSGMVENCTALRRTSHDWDDRQCTKELSYICEKPGKTVTTPPTTATTPTSTALTPTKPTTIKTSTEVPVTTAGSRLVPCPKSYKNPIRQFENCYVIIEEKMTWHDANKKCKDLGVNSSLVSIRDGGENNFVAHIVKKSGLTNKKTGMWLGLTDKESIHENQFTFWSDGSALTVTYFDTTQQPSLFGNMDCAEIRNGKHWFVTHCTYKRPFICKWSNQTKKVPHRPAPPTHTRYCLPGFIKYRSSCYKLVREPATFSNADKRCRALVDNKYNKYAHLARIDDYQDNEFLVSQLLPMKGNAAWIGLHYQESMFHWTDNEPMQYTRWPVNMSYTGANTTCVSLGTSFVTSLTGFWYARNCNEKLPYLCQAPMLGETEIAGRVNCPVGYFAYEAGGTCYKYVEGLHIFEKAHTVCANESLTLHHTHPHMSVSLLTLTSIYEMSFIRAYALSVGYPRDTPVWLGLHLKENKNVWKWLNGNPVNFTYTSGLDPNTKGCFYLRLMNKKNVYGMHADHTCQNRYGTICKLAPVLAFRKPKECLTTKEGYNYVGHKATAKSGRSCVRWDLIQDMHLMIKISKGLPGGSISDASNFCRHPQISNVKQNGPYCYTSVGGSGSSGPRLEECDIPLCPRQSHGYVVVVAILFIVLLVTISFFVGVMLWRRTNTARGFIPYLRQHDPEGGTSFHNPIYTPAATC